MRLPLLTAVAVLAAASPAAGQTVVDPGPVSAVASGAQRAVWTVPAPDPAAAAAGAVVLRSFDPSGATITLNAAPIQLSPELITIGHGPGGDATAVYGGCRGGCATFAYNLEKNVERQLEVPPGPQGCENVAPRFDGGRLHFVRVGPRRCRPGLYQVRGRRSIRRLPGSDLSPLTLEDGRAVWTRVDPKDDLRVQVVMRDLGSGRGRVLLSDDGPSVDCDVSRVPTLRSRRMLLLGVRRACSGGAEARVELLELTRRGTRCRALAPPEGEAERLVDFAFAGSRVLYRRERTGAGGHYELVELAAPAFGPAQRC